MPLSPNFNPNWSKEDHPIVNVSWYDAVAYCGWLSGVTGLQVSLPTEAQWEKAARGTDGRTYPWGNDWDNSNLWCSVETVRSGTCAVGQYADSPYGLSDMAGNVWQYCSDYYDENYYRTSPLRNPTGPASSPHYGFRVQRGGAWGSIGGAKPYGFRGAMRSCNAPDLSNLRGTVAVFRIGFRCVVSANSQ